MDAVSMTNSSTCVAVRSMTAQTETRTSKLGGNFSMAVDSLGCESGGGIGTGRCDGVECVVDVVDLGAHQNGQILEAVILAEQDRPAVIPFVLEEDGLDFE